MRKKDIAFLCGLIDGDVDVIYYFLLYVELHYLKGIGNLE